MIAFLAFVAHSAEPPEGIAGQWRLTRVETSEESWNYADKAAEWAKYAKDRCHETDRLLTLSGEEVALLYRWECDEPGLGIYRSERSIVVSVQWDGDTVTVPPAEGMGRFVRLQPPDLGIGRRTVAILPAQEREVQVGPASWQAELVPPPPRSKEPPSLRLSRKTGEVWILAPVAVAAEGSK